MIHVEASFGLKFQTVKDCVRKLYCLGYFIPFCEGQLSSFIAWFFQHLTLCHMEFANVHKIATRRERDEVAATNVCSVLDRFADTQILDFLVDAVEQLTEARPPEKTKTR